MKYAVMLLLLVRIFESAAQDLPSDTQIYGFINTAISPAGEEAYSLSERSSFVFLSGDTSWMRDSIFTEADINYFRAQLKEIYSFKWQTGKINGARIIPAASIKRIFKDRKNGWTKFTKKYGTCLSNFSMPIFSLDGNHCIIQTSTQCDWLAGGGSTRLYRKTANGWEFVEEYMRWIS